MASDQPDTSIDSGPSPAVSSLRSRFEKLAAHTEPLLSSSPPLSSSGSLRSPRPVSTHGLLTPEPQASPRPRTMSSSLEQKPETQSLRTVSSSSDLKSGVKRPPPPPPVQRAPKGPGTPVGPSPSGSPLIRPLDVTPPPVSPSRLPAAQDAKNVAGLGPRTGLLIDDTIAPSSGAVASLINKFASTVDQAPSNSKPSLPLRPLIAARPSYNTTRSAPPAEFSNVSSLSSLASSSLASSQPSLLDSSIAYLPLHGPNSAPPIPPSSTRPRRSPFDSLASVDASMSSASPDIVTTSEYIESIDDEIQVESPFGDGDNDDMTEVAPDTETETGIDSGAESELSISSPPSLPPRKSKVINGVPHDRNASLTSSDSSEPHVRAESGSVSSESDFSLTSAPSSRPSTRPRLSVPPRPPPRARSSISPTSSTISLPLPSSPLNPPPLPQRRPGTIPKGASEDVDAVHAQAPRLPARGVPASLALSIPPLHPPASASAPAVTSDRKSLGNSKLPPPPTRMIALGDKLPPPRRPPSPSSDDDSEGDDSKSARELAADAMPDSSRSSRRPPYIPFFNYSEMRIHVPAFAGRALVAGGNVVVGSGHHVRGYDVARTDTPLWTFDTRESGRRDARVSALQWRAARREAERGVFVWVGTREGHIFEIDARTGCMTASKLGAHAQAVSHIMRSGARMVSVDEAGKVLVFEPGEDGEDVRLSYTQPRVLRIAEQQDFINILAGRLWTSSRADMSNGHGGTTARTPSIRVYDITASGTASAGRTILPSSHVGAVTSGTVLPSHPGHVYLGHEAGFISIWSTPSPDALPQCVDVIKVSASDVLSLEGVNDRLWAGGRQGTISAYDVSNKPWVVTNSWQAHTDLPVMKLFVDPFSIEKSNRLTVVSVGRDEQLKFWDGLLGSDWVDQELLKREKEYSTFRDINVLIVSWNVDAAKPETLNGDQANINFLHDVLSSVDSPDIIAFGLQEVIDLESRKMAAKSVLYGTKKKTDDGKISEKVSSSYKRWHDRLMLSVRLAMSPDVPYTVVHTENLVGLFTCIFVKNTERISLKDVALNTIKRGMGGRYGNKGGIVTRMVMDDSSLCFINCHLAAGQHHVRQRNADVAAFVEARTVFPSTDAVEEPLAYVGGGDGSMVLDHEIVFISGDMNYRIDQRRDAAVASIKASDWAALLHHDQLTKEMKFNRGFRLRSFHEGPLNFTPTYKYDRRSNEFDSSEKRRVPAWCDRVLWRSREPSRVRQLSYRRWEANVSDHRPISSTFTVTIKSVRKEMRELTKAEVQALWLDYQQHLLLAAHEFYVSQALL